MSDTRDRRRLDRGRLTVALLCSVVMGACSSDSGSGNESDVGSDAAPDAPIATSDRELIEIGLLGSSPLDNLVADPSFTRPLTEFDQLRDGWFFFRRDGSTPRIRVLHLPSTPTRQPVLWLPGAPVNADAAALGEVRVIDGPLIVSVWIGRTEADADLELETAIDLSGFDEQSHADQLWRLEPEEGTEETIDGIVWRRYFAFVNDGPLGFATLVIGDLSDRDFYMTGPLVVPAETGENGLAFAASRHRATPRSVDGATGEWLEHYRVQRARAPRTGVPP